MLKIHEVTVMFGPFAALRHINLEVQDRELVVLLGVNGAGKSTLFRAITGLERPSSGEILFAGKPLHRLSPVDVVRSGISLCPEGRKLFPGLTVQKNLALGAYVWRRDRNAVKESLELVYTLFPVLWEKKNELAGALSGGQQQMVAIGRALMSRPRLLLLDEPSLGLAPLVVEQLFQTIVDVVRSGTMVLMAEQNAYSALQIAHRGYVLEQGRVILQGSRRDLLDNSEVKRAYIGV